MARPKAFINAQKDGYVTFRVTTNMSNDVNDLCFLMNTNEAEIVSVAIREFCDKHRASIDAVKTVKIQALLSAAIII